MKVVIKDIPTVDIWPNTGQIPGLPQNPRFIRDERYEKLVKSIKDDPEMLGLRECIVYPYAGGYIAIAGNMRLRATIEVQGMDEVEYSELVTLKLAQDDTEDNSLFKGWKKAIDELRNVRTIPCKILPENTPAAKLRAIAIKDNVSFGQDNFDMLANEWDQIELEDFGMIAVDWGTAHDNEQEDIDNEQTPEETESGEIDPPIPSLVVAFDDLQVYDTVKTEIEELLKGYPGASLKE